MFGQRARKAKSHRPAVSGAELEVLKVLWEFGPGTVREINKVLRQQRRRWAYTTVLTLLHRLETKGYLTRDRSRLAHIFHPAVSREGLLRQHLRELADQLCGGTGTPLVLALVQECRFSEKEIEQFRKLLDQLEKGKPKKKRKE